MANISAKMVKELRERTGLGMMDCKKALVETEGDMDKAIKLLREKGIIKGAKKSGRETNEGVIKVFDKDNGKEALIMMVNCETDFVVRNENFQKLVEELGSEILNDGSIQDMSSVPESINKKITEAIAVIGENIKLNDIKKIKAKDDKEYISNYVHSNSKVGVLLKLSVEKPDTTKNETFQSLAKDLCMQIAAMEVKALRKEDVDDEMIASEKEIYIKQAKDSGKPENIIEKIVEGKIRKIYEEITLVGQKFVKDDSLTVEKHINNISKEVGDKISPVEFVKFSII